MLKILPLLLMIFPIICFSAEKSKILENYKWQEPSENNIAFHTIWLGKENTAPTLYLQIGEYFAKINFAPKQQLGKKYTIAKNKKINLFYRKIEDGKELFEKAIAIDTPSNNIIIGISQDKEKLEAKIADISLTNIPLGSSAIINIAPYKIGITKNNKPYTLNPFEVFKINFPTKGKYKMGMISIFDIRKKPKLMLQRMLGGTEFERVILYIFSTEVPTSESIPLDQNQILPIVEK